MSDVNADFTISLEKAQEYARRWRDPKETFDYKAQHGFLIPLDNLQALIDHKAANSTSVRAYLGIDDNGYAKLMMVGTVPYLHGTGIHDDMLPDSVAPVPVGKIYNFTRPCPPFCAHISSLNDLPKII